MTKNSEEIKLSDCWLLFCPELDMAGKYNKFT